MCRRGTIHIDYVLYIFQGQKREISIKLKLPSNFDFLKWACRGNIIYSTSKTRKRREIDLASLFNILHLCKYIIIKLLCKYTMSKR